MKQNYIITFTNSGKTLNVFKGNNALDAEFLFDYKFETREIAENFAQLMSQELQYKIIKDKN